MRNTRRFAFSLAIATVASICLLYPNNTVHAAVRVRKPQSATLIDKQSQNGEAQITTFDSLVWAKPIEHIAPIAELYQIGSDMPASRLNILAQSRQHKFVQRRRMGELVATCSPKPGGYSNAHYRGASNDLSDYDRHERNR